MNKYYYKQELKRYWNEAIVGVEGYNMVIIKNVFLKLLFLIWYTYQSITVYYIIKNCWLIGTTSQYGIVIDLADVLLFILLSNDFFKHVSFLVYNSLMFLLTKK